MGTFFTLDEKKMIKENYGNLLNELSDLRNQYNELEPLLSDKMNKIIFRRKYNKLIDICEEYNRLNIYVERYEKLIHDIFDYNLIKEDEEKEFNMNKKVYEKCQKYLTYYRLIIEKLVNNEEKYYSDIFLYQNFYDYLKTYLNKINFNVVDESKDLTLEMSKNSQAFNNCYEILFQAVNEGMPYERFIELLTDYIIINKENEKAKENLKKQELEENKELEDWSINYLLKDSNKISEFSRDDLIAVRTSLLQRINSYEFNCQNEVLKLLLEINKKI